MKRLLFIIFASVIGAFAFSQEAENAVSENVSEKPVEKREVRAGLQMGTNMEQSDGYTFVLGLFADTAIVPDVLLIGSQMDWTFSHSGYTANPSFYLQWLMPLHVGNVMTPYLKGNLGMFTLHENNQTTDGLLAGLEAGLSFKFNKFYLEPGFQFGYPYMWGAVVRAGLAF